MRLGSSFIERFEKLMRTALKRWPRDAAFQSTIANGDSATLVLDATVDAGTVGSTITNVAQPTAMDQLNSDGTNDVGSVDITVQASEFRVVTGSYVGDGLPNRVITGAGFQPDLVIIKGDSGEEAVARTETMSPVKAKGLGSSAP